MIECPFKVGDRIIALMTLPDGQSVPQGLEIATVTEITARGFKYDYGKPRPWIPRWGISFTGHGEHYLDAYEGQPLLWRRATDEEETWARAEGVGHYVQTTIVESPSDSPSVTTSEPVPSP
jgi:hypothetical protein